MRIKFNFIFAFFLLLITVGTGCSKIKKTNTESTNKLEQNTLQNKIDIDLTKMSSTVIYSTVFNMMVEPENYIGKTIRMKGLFYCSDDDPEADLPRRVFACVIQDATACCAQGLEFRLKESLTYPDDFPPTNSDITVTGVFFHEEDNFDFFGIKDAVLES
ncbi:MAG: hypothetical protein IKI31_01805 [Treponema sp.]|nr:hypothetical protein [Treponema sp.]